jgi:hypothetical protein
MASEQPKFERLPADCTCNGEALVLVRHYPRLGFMPELMAYGCAVCGHVEAIEVIQPEVQKTA